MTRPQLKVQKRQVLGRKVKKLRRENIVPANIYGKKTASLAIQLAFPEFNQIYRKTGEASIVDLIVDNASNPRHTLIRNVQIHPVTGRVLHIDFMQIDLKEKIEAEISIKLVGKPLAVQEKKALLLQELNELTIEAPADKLPEEILVKVDALQKVGDTLYVKDLKLPAEVKLKTDAKRVVARLDELVAKEAEELAREEKAAAEESKIESAEKTEEKTPKEKVQAKKEEPKGERKK